MSPIDSLSLPNELDVKTIAWTASKSAAPIRGVLSGLPSEMAFFGQIPEHHAGKYATGTGLQVERTPISLSSVNSKLKDV